MEDEAATDQRVETAGDFAALLAALETSSTKMPQLVVAALCAVRNGVITGEGPTTTGRIHYSRCIDAVDAALIRRILIAGGNRAITRAEADVLFEIHDAAFERTDGGAFDDLFAKAIAHHVLAAAGHRVPARATALTSPLADWAALDDVAVRGEIAAWLDTSLRRKGRNHGPLTALTAFVGTAAGAGVSVAAVVDLAA
jgi:hypothetical protein